MQHISPRWLYLSESGVGAALLSSTSIPSKSLMDNNSAAAFPQVDSGMTTDAAQLVAMELCGFTCRSRALEQPLEQPCNPPHGQHPGCSGKCWSPAACPLHPVAPSNVPQLLPQSMPGQTMAARSTVAFHLQKQCTSPQLSIKSSGCTPCPA